MDIHRCRFVPYNPQAINALAFSHPPSADLKGRGVPTLRLAIGRANGDIEIWNPHRGTWFQESILRGGKDRSIEALVWTRDPDEEEDDDNDTSRKVKVPGKLRLFSIGYSSVVTEWDLEQGRPARHSSGHYGEIWCLAAQPTWKPNRKGKDGKPLPPAEGEYTGQHLAVGCADGSIVILSTQDGDLKYLRTMRPSTKRSRILSITFQNRNTAIAGYADGSMRVFDIRNGKLLRTISLGRGPAKGSKELLVWSVKCLPDGTIVSGDSAGEVRFWDSKNFSLVQRIHSHLADVLDVAVSGDGSSVISGGADQRTVVYRLKESEKGARTQRWTEVTHRRYHTHDVKALAVYETKDISIVVSGGLDTVPVVVPLREYGKEHHRKLSNLPQTPQLSSSASSRLIMSWWDREVNLWHIPGSISSDPHSFDDQSHKLVGKVLFQGEENLSAAALSPDGDFFVAATINQIKMFSLKREKGDQDAPLKVHKLEIPAVLSKHGAKAVAISPNSQWVCLVRPNNDIYMARTVNDVSSESMPQISPKLTKLRRVPRPSRSEKLHHGSLGAYDRTVHCVTFSGDSSLVACGDLSGCIDAWQATESKVPGRSSAMVNGRESSEEDSFSSDEDDSSEHDGQPWQRSSLESPLPRLKSGILLMSFRPMTAKSNSVDDRLIVLTADHQLSELKVLDGKLSDWSRRNPKAYLPAEFTSVKDRAKGALWDVTNGHDRLWLYGPSWLWMFDLSQDLPPSQSEEEEEGKSRALQKSSSNKRKRDAHYDNEVSSKTNTGAGDSIPLSESGFVLGRKMRKVVGSNPSEGEWVDLHRTRKPEGENEDPYYDNDESIMAKDSTLARLRREQLDASEADESSDEENRDIGHIPNGTSAAPSRYKQQVAFAVVIDNRKAENIKGQEWQSTTGKSDGQLQKTSDSDREQNVTSQRNRRWWHTFKYREILGIAPLNDTQDQGLEVAVVERPMWDVNLPGRYIRDYE